MSQLSTSVQARSRAAFASVLQSLADPGTQRNVALAMGVSESTVSRTKATLEDAITLLYQLGWKVVDSSRVCYPADYVLALHTMARMHMRNDPEPLQWD